MAKQNIYDNETFFEGYKALRDKEVNANNLFEMPALFSLLPDLTGKRVLDLGCGFGEHCMEYIRREASRSQLGLCVCTLCTISVRAEPTFERLRYSFGGDRPSQTAHLTVSPDQIHGRRLENQQYKGGIPTAPPPELTPGFLRLPPILYMHYRSSVLGYSKAPWGLSV